MGTKVTVTPLGNPISSSFTTELNNTLDELSDEFDNVVYRDGTQSMLGNINMNSKRMYNLPDASAMDEPATLRQLIAVESAFGLSISGMPSVINRAALAASDTLQNTVFLREANREGVFVFDGSDFSAQVTSDPTQGIYVAPDSDPTGASGAWVRRLNVEVTPEMFGAVGDGVTDDSAALRSMATFVNAIGGGRVTYGKDKVYFVNRFVGDGGSPAVSLSDNGGMAFVGCRGLIIEGNGATIETRGNWDRSDSSFAGLNGIQIDDCEHVHLTNLELDGNVDSITNTSGAGVSATNGVNLRSSRFVNIDRVNAHHFISDGIKIRETATLVNGVRVACRNVRITNSKFSFNTRIAFTPGQVRGLVVENCEMSYSGFVDDAETPTPFTNGGGPQAGINVEPNNTPNNGDPQDVLTGEITFTRCKIFGNAASAVLCSKFANNEFYMEEVHFDKCDIECNDGTGGGSDGMIFDCPNGSVTDCVIKMRDRVLYVGFQLTVATPRQKFSGNFVYGRSVQTNGIFSTRAQSGGRTVIENNQFIAEHTAPVAGPWIFRLENPFAIVRGNTFHIPKEAYVDLTGTDLLRAVKMDVSRAEGNTYTTDLLASSGSNSTAHYGVMYGASTHVRNERFNGTATGLADTFRPGDFASSLTAVAHTGLLYGKNDNTLITNVGNANLTVTELSTPIQRFDTTLTANRTVTLPAPNAALPGRRFRIVRDAGGAFSLTVQTSAAVALKTLHAAGHWVLVQDDGTEYRVLSFKNDLIGSQTTDVGSIAAGASSNVAITVTGAAVGDDAFVSLSDDLPVGVIVSHVKVTANTVTIRLLNVTAGPLDPASITYNARVFKR